MIGVPSTLVPFGCQKFSAVGYGLPLLVVPASMATATMLGSVIQEIIDQGLVVKIRRPMRY